MAAPGKKARGTCMRLIFISLVGGNRHILTVGNSASSAFVFRNTEGTPTLTDKREIECSQVWWHPAVRHLEVGTGESGVQGRLSLP